MVQYVAQNDTHKKWLHIINTVSKLNKANKDKKRRGAEVLAQTYFRNAYPVFEVMEDGKYLLQLHYTKKDKYLSQTVSKQDTLVKFLKQITKKDFVLQGLLFEEGQEKDIYSEMKPKEVDYDYYMKLLDQEKVEEQKVKEEEKRLNEQEELFKKKQQEKQQQIIDPFGGGFIGGKVKVQPEPIIEEQPLEVGKHINPYDNTFEEDMEDDLIEYPSPIVDKVSVDIPDDDLPF